MRADRLRARDNDHTALVRTIEAIADVTPPVLYSRATWGAPMHTTYLRKAGGSVMLAVPSTLLDDLNLAAGAKVNVSVEDGRLVIAPGTCPSYSLEELLAQCDDTDADDNEDRAWFDAAPVGSELL